MHFEILVEDRSGKEALEILIPKIVGEKHTFRVHPYRGVGRLPTGLRMETDPKKKMLLTQLPKLLQGYGATFAGYPPNFKAAVICICDLDRRCRHDFRLELLDVLDSLDPRPEAYFCIAEEESEAWLLGDAAAVKSAYPRARQAVLDSYAPDSICGTWETLADAVHPGGVKQLATQEYSEIGAAKCSWAQNIPPHMNVESNASPSFRYLRDKLRMIIGT